MKTTPQQMIDECLSSISDLNSDIATEQSLIDNNNADIDIFNDNIKQLNTFIVERQNDNVRINNIMGVLYDRIDVENATIDFINSH